MAGQHPGSRKAFLHYSSDKLRQDSMEDAEQLVAHFADMIAKLESAGRHNAMEAQRKLRQVEQEYLKYQQNTTKALEAAEQRATLMDKETAYLRGLVEEARRMGVAGLEANYGRSNATEDA